MATDISTTEGASIQSWLNQRVDTSIDRGECWDAAERGIKSVGARRPNSAQLYVWGRVIAANAVRVGDILQFSNYVVRVTDSNGGFQENSFGMPRHTAVVSYLNSNGSVDVLHQNYDNVRTVQLLEWVFLRAGTFGTDTVTIRGSVTCYRPQKP